MDWSLLGCGASGHVTFAPDEPGLRERLGVSTREGAAWRCLRCGTFVIGEPTASGPVSAAPRVRRDKELRSALILRVFAVERLGRTCTALHLQHRNLIERKQQLGRTARPAEHPARIRRERMIAQHAAEIRRAWMMAEHAAHSVRRFGRRRRCDRGRARLRRPVGELRVPRGQERPGSTGGPDHHARGEAANRRRDRRAGRGRRRNRHRQRRGDRSRR